MKPVLDMQNIMKKYKINECFYSLQGEGYWTGTPAVFLRFAGCNLSCDFCDTDHSTTMVFTIQEIEKLLNVIRPSGLIVPIDLTGGEPMLQVDYDLLSFLKKHFWNIHIETNGTILIPEKFETLIDWITISPKKNQYYNKGQELKFVYQNQTDDQLSRIIANSNFLFYYLQPCSMSNVEATVKAVKRNRGWKLSLQTQKIINIR